MHDGSRRESGESYLAIKMKEDHEHVEKYSTSEDFILSIEETIKGLKK